MLLVTSGNLIACTFLHVSCRNLNADNCGVATCTTTPQKVCMRHWLFLVSEKVQLWICSPHNSCSMMNVVYFVYSVQMHTCMLTISQESLLWYELAITRQMSIVCLAKLKHSRLGMPICTSWYINVKEILTVVGEIGI